MMIHLETLMTWSLTALTAREVGHMFLYESAVFSPFGDGGYTLRARPVPGQAPLRCAKDKSIAHYVRSHKSVCNECMLACARTKDKNHKRQSLAQRRDLWCYAPMYCPLRGQCHGANAGKCTQTTSALHKGVFYDRTCSLRSHKSVRSAFSALALAQRRVL